jgi:D-alanine transfer protein
MAAAAEPGPLVRWRHLVAAGAALVLVCAVLWAAEMRAVSLERRYAHRVAPEQFNQKNRGTAFQRAGVAQADLLPLYGSSELQTLNDPYHASNFFREYPTGFTVFTVGDIGTTTLIMVQSLASLGDAARGRKVVFSLSPYWYYQVKDYSKEYAGNFSALQAGELVFSPLLSPGLKQRIARRMLDYPATLESRPILRLATGALAERSLRGRMIYMAAWPLGCLDNWVLRLQDHWESVAQIGHATPDPSPVKRPAPIDWPSVIDRAEQDFASHSDNNPFGFDNHYYKKKFQRALAKNTITDASFREGLSRSTEWTDLDLLLQVARELGAKPLVICAPSPGRYYDYLGISEDLRHEYYQTFERHVEAHGVPVLNFAEHDRSSFVLDPGAHPSEVAWAYYDRALDAFFHDAIR